MEMALVFLLSATPKDAQTEFNLSVLQDALKCAERDRFRVHSLTSDPNKADLIIFLERYGGGWYFERVRGHPLVRRYREKCFLFSPNALVIPFLPGVFTGVEKSWATARTRPGFYLGVTKNEFAVYTPPSDDVPYLFSFMGSIRTASVRAKLATLRHPRGFFQNTADDYDRILAGVMDQRERQQYHHRYAELIEASKFVICPRGVSPSSIRLFETMQMGRVPVILSDGWVAPSGPRWSDFSIRVAEADWAQIPRLLEDREMQAVRMGELARKAWEEWFSEEVIFHRLVELCLDIKRGRKIPEAIGRWTAYRHFLQPFHFRRMVGRGLRAVGLRGPSEAPGGVT